MPAQRQHPITLQSLAAVYQTSRQNAGLIVKKYGFAVASNPSDLWAAMLATGRACPLRSRLTDPLFRCGAAQQLATLAKP